MWMVFIEQQNSVMKNSIVIILITLAAKTAFGQACTPQGDQNTYGSNNTWIGYVYDGTAFNTYTGYVNEGNSASPYFNESFGGNAVNYATNGCTVYTETFSVRYKLTKTFADANYLFTVGGDDGIRLSLDGGSTWVINHWNDEPYTTYTYTVHLNGTYNMVLEYYENGGGNQVSFDVQAVCTGSGNPATYGTNNIWAGYLYTGMNFDIYKGYVTEGNSLTSNFDEGFGGDNVNYGTSDCPVSTNQFSARYRLQKTFTNGTYKFIVGGDDGYRLSLDGGTTWAINKWNDQSYGTTTYNTTLNGTYNMVLEYYENGGQNRLSFNVSGGTILPVTLSQFSGKMLSTHAAVLEWRTMMERNTDHFSIQRSSDGYHFEEVGQVYTQLTDSTHDYELIYSYTDKSALPGTSYYRLQILDRNGRYNYSDVIRLVNDKYDGIRIFPTVNQHSNFFVETGKSLKNARLEFFDLTGKKLSEASWETLSGRQSVYPEKAGRLASGTYLARLSSDGKPVLNQLVILQ